MSPTICHRVCQSVLQVVWQAQVAKINHFRRIGVDFAAVINDCRKMELPHRLRPNCVLRRIWKHHAAIVLDLEMVGAGNRLEQGRTVIDERFFDGEAILILVEPVLNQGTLSLQFLEENTAIGIDAFF